jgi:hypothetical protein
MGSKQIKLLKKSENVTQNVSLLVKTIPQNAKQLQHERLITSKMSKWYSISLQEFSSVCVVIASIPVKILSFSSSKEIIEVF